MSKDHPMLHEKTEDMLLNKCKQRHNEFGQYRYWSSRKIEGIRYRETTAYEKIDSALKASGWKDIKVGDEWGGDGQFAWFRMQFSVPKEFDGKPLVAILRFGAGGWNGGEGCLFINGVPYQGVDSNHTDVLLAKKAKAGQKYDLVCECVSTQLWQNQRYNIKFEQADIAVLNYDVQDYWYDLGFLNAIAEQLPWGSRRRATIIRTANKSVDAFDFEAGSFEGLASTARNASKILAPCYKKQADASALEFACAGHSHIDVAWLWPYAETIRKCSRTFSTVDRLMDEYPDYLFTQSQAQLYEFTKDNYPDLYERIKKRVKERRFEPQGSMWVEADCNICSGESLVRQVMLGKMYFMDEFDIETDILWLPDVFGYSAALPQILKKSGVDYFMTIKISWSQFNKFPYSSFYWEGIDGTRVLAHFPPTNDYNARILPNQLLPGAENYREKDRSDIALYPFGYGDGGGGPTRDHLEHMKRAANLEGVPKCTPMWAADFYKQLVKRSEDLPSWVGELYLEYHRGTYTTQARNKRANRKSELLLRDAEMAAGLAWAYKGLKYPHEEITRTWKCICKNQFHDVIPGTSVTAVYEDTAVDYANIAQTGTKIRTAGLEKLGGKSAEAETIRVFNSLSWVRGDAVKVPVPGKARQWHAETEDGRPLPSQPAVDDPSMLWVQPCAVPGVGIGTIKLVKGAPKDASSTRVYASSLENESRALRVGKGMPKGASSIKATESGMESEFYGTKLVTGASIKVAENGMENEFYRIKLDKGGVITSIFDKKAKREVLPKGERANLFQLFEDKPLAWDAWDIDFYYVDKFTNITDAAEIKVEEAGAVRGALKIVRKFGSSTVEQRIVLWASTPRIDFETHADWHENQKMLKVAFPVDVHANSARFEIQYGSVDRPNHWNTSWDFARVEVAAQKWVDMSQADYGVSLMNDCKYGHDVHENVLRLTLLRSPKHPDPTADRGEHFFTYSLMPHQGDWRDGEVVRRSYELNVPMVAWASTSTPPLDKGGPGGVLLSLDAPNVVIDAVKKAEREDALVVRMYECHGIGAECRLDAGFKVGSASECDLLERDQARLKLDGNGLTLSLKPFEIKTVKLSR